MTPRADWVCNSKKCSTEDGQPVYELPVNASRCPVCGSKRIARLFNKVGVIGTRSVQPEMDPRLTSSSHFQRSSAMLQSHYDDRASKLNVPDGMRSEAIAVSQVGSGKAAPMDQMAVAAVWREDMKRHQGPVAPSSVMKVMGRAPIPTTIRGRE